MSSAIFRGRGKLRPRRPFAKATESKPTENKSKNYSYALMAALVGLIALLPLIGLLGVSNIQSQISAVVPSVLLAQSFSCKSSTDIARDFSGFAFDTNSTIDNFSINRNSKVVTVGVHGPDGSAGIFCISIPTNFISIKELKATIDNIPANANIEEFPNTNIVSLVYHHSDRVIRIFGGQVPSPSPTPSTNSMQISGAGGQQQVVVVIT